MRRGTVAPVRVWERTVPERRPDSFTPQVRIPQASRLGIPAFRVASLSNESLVSCQAVEKRDANAVKLHLS